MEMFRFMVVRSPEKPDDDSTSPVSLKIDPGSLRTRIKGIEPAVVSFVEDLYETGHLVNKLGSSLDGSLSIENQDFNLDEIYAVAVLAGMKRDVTRELENAIRDRAMSDLEVSQLSEISTLPLLVDSLGALFDDEEAINGKEIRRRPHFGPVGIGDLHVVEQRLKRYELSEIAHIENVLSGEFRERTHNVTTTTEFLDAEENETNETIEKDLESENRFELSEQAKQTQREDQSLNAGLDVTASYGKIVTNANLDYAASKSKEASRDTSKKYAKGVTERARTRVQERHLRRSERRTSIDVEQRNVHRFEASNKSVTGLYHHVDKVYEAQLLNKGKRLLFEFFIPEPARWWVGRPDSNDSQIELPDAPTAPSVDLNSINPDTYIRISAEHGVFDPPIPPANSIIRSASASDHDTRSTGSQYFSKDGEIEVPEGYNATQAKVTIVSYRDHDKTPSIQVSLLGRVIDPGEHYREIGVFHEDKTFEDEFDVDQDNALAEKIPYIVQSKHDSSVGVTIDLTFEPTEDTQRNWRVSVYQKILEKYEVELSAYEQRVQVVLAREESTSAASGFSSPEHPLKLRKIENNEIKRRALEILGRETQRDSNGRLPTTVQTTNFGRRTNFKYRSHELLTDFFEDPYFVPEDFSPEAHQYPLIDIEKLERIAPVIRFAEQAFEWSDMSYVFYPYFWTDSRRWRDVLARQHKDATHEGFLKAGAARVIVPVRPGFEKIVHHFVASGEIATESEAPEITDDTWIPLYKEIQEQQGYDPDKPELVDCWEVTVPTELVALNTPELSLPNHGESSSCEILRLEREGDSLDQ